MNILIKLKTAGVVYFFSVCVGGGGGGGGRGGGKGEGRGRGGRPACLGLFSLINNPHIKF